MLGLILAGGGAALGLIYLVTRGSVPPKMESAAEPPPEDKPGADTLVNGAKALAGLGVAAVPLLSATGTGAATAAATGAAVAVPSVAAVPTAATGAVTATGATATGGGAALTAAASPLLTIAAPILAVAGLSVAVALVSQAEYERIAAENEEKIDALQDARGGTEAIATAERLNAEAGGEIIEKASLVWDSKNQLRGEVLGPIEW